MSEMAGWEADKGAVIEYGGLNTLIHSYVLLRVMTS